MQLLLNTLFIIIIFSIIPNCSKNKKTVTEFPSANSIYLFDQNTEIELFKEAGPKSLSLGKIKGAELGLITASVEVVIDGKSQTFYRMECPLGLKSKCDDGKAYFPSRFLVTTGFLKEFINNGTPVSFPKESVGILDDKVRIENALALRTWLSSPSKMKEIGLTGIVSTDSFNIAILSLYPNPDDRLKVLTELLLLSELSEDKNYSDSRYDAVFKKYAILKDFSPGDTSVFGISVSETKDLVSGLQSQKSNIEKSFYTGFPLRTSTYKGFVAQFNKFKNHYFVQETLFQKIIENGAYSVKGIPVQYFLSATDNSKAIEILKKINPDIDVTSVIGNGNLEFLGREGIKLNVSLMDVNGNSSGQESYNIKSITAEENGGSVGFRLKTDTGEFFLIPMEVTDYLLTSGQGFKEFLATLPKDYKEILKNNDYEKAVMLVAAKFGKGGFDESTGKMNYFFSTGDRYWTILEIIRLNPELIRETEYSGYFKNSYGSPDCIDDLKWRQPKGEFYVSGLPGCTDGEDKRERSENLCFYEKGADDLVVTFSPADLRAEKPKINLYMPNQSDGICKYININILHSAEALSGTEQ